MDEDVYRASKAEDRLGWSAGVHGHDRQSMWLPQHKEVESLFDRKFPKKLAERVLEKSAG